MGRRRKRRKIIRRVIRRIPSVFECPNCGRRAVTVEIDKKDSKAVVRCGECELKAEFKYSPVYKPVDFYNMFVDAFYEGRLLQIASVTGGGASEEVKG